MRVLPCFNFSVKALHFDEIQAKGRRKKIFLLQDAQKRKKQRFELCDEGSEEVQGISEGSTVHRFAGGDAQASPGFRTQDLGVESQHAR